MIQMERSPHVTGNSLPIISKWKVPSFCNKATVINWMQSAIVNTSDAGLEAFGMLGPIL